MGGGGYLFLPWDQSSERSCILGNPLYDLSIASHHRDPESRIVIINLIIQKVKLSICNIYAPNNPVQQDKFIQSLNEILLSKVEIDNIIIGGDWNVTLERIDKKKGCVQWKPSPYRDKLLLMMEELNLSDVFKKKNPSKKKLYI